MVVPKRDCMSRLQGLTACVDLQSGSNPRRPTFILLGNSSVNLGDILQAEQQLFVMTS